ncbi:hypothetical protein A2U01_0018443, partial [Trifolium medium]|nr:hypothetical protein [Trifolium medium]
VVPNPPSGEPILSKSGARDIETVVSSPVAGAQVPTPITKKRLRKGNSSGVGQQKEMHQNRMKRKARGLLRHSIHSLKKVARLPSKDRREGSDKMAVEDVWGIGKAIGLSLRVTIQICSVCYLGRLRPSRKQSYTGVMISFVRPCGGTPLMGIPIAPRLERREVC